jgi:type IV pilus modification protein PilV
MYLKHQSGFSMLEVLVAMVIIMFGALGIAGMQLLAITSTENARYQNVATMMGGSLAAMMQGNVAYWGSPPASIQIAGTTVTGGPPAFTDPCVGLANVCDESQMAAYDLQKWGEELAKALPSGTAAITCPAGNSPAICSVTLTWSEKNVSVNNATTTETGELAAGKNQDHTYQTLVSIL